MQRKSIYLIGFILLLTIQDGFCQSDSSFTIVDRSKFSVQLEIGKKALRERNYLKAIQTFRILADKNPNDAKVLFWLSKVHFVFRNYGYSVRYAEDARLLDSAGTPKEALFLLAQNYHHLGELKKAISFYELCLQSYSKKEIADYDISRFLRQATYAYDQQKKPIFSKKRILTTRGINSGFDDYAPILSIKDSSLYFTSRRSNTTGGYQNPDDGKFFEDIYVANWNTEEKDWDTITNHGSLQKVNGNGFESISWISKDGKTAYVTINNELSGNIRTKSSDIFEITLSEKGKWSKPKNNSTAILNSSGFDAGATLTADENTLYFTSDRNLERGSDIFMSTKVNGTWTAPVALSSVINTVGNETTPYITPDGQMLFFSSDEHLGMGGYDIFYSKNLGANKWSDPVNLGASINTTNDDTHFQWYPELQRAFFASRINKNSKSDMDIFEIEMKNFKP